MCGYLYLLFPVFEGLRNKYYYTKVYVVCVRVCVCVRVDECVL